MKTKLTSFFFFVLLNFFAFAQYAVARGGGGGSGGGGGGGGGGGSFSSHSSGSSGGGTFDPWFLLFPVSIFIVFSIIAYYANKERIRRVAAKQAAIISGNKLNWPELQTQITILFQNFQKAWSEFDFKTMERLVTPEYYKRMVLELSVLQNENRTNLMSDVIVTEMFVVGEEQPGETTQKLTLQISASAHDVLKDTKSNKILFEDNSSFTEFWHLVQTEDKRWVLDFITQETEDSGMYENDIAEFSKKNKFYYDADFGWLMMPDKGVLFNKTDFGKSDINNHVIGYFRDKIVEFYTYIPNTQSKYPENYVIAQAILPKSYNDILIKKKKLLSMPVWGLKKMSLESVDFNNKFSIWAHEDDQINSLELLSPNFMEKIYNLPFELNIELVGNTLYFYTKDRGAANYPQMLEIISWAFDEMRM